jgi:hypothetical protein
VKYLLALAIACGSARPAAEAVCWDACPGASAVDHEKPATVGPDGWAEWCECHCANDYFRGAEFVLPIGDVAAARSYFAGQCNSP